jgi:hypothetical protein
MEDMMSIFVCKQLQARSLGGQGSLQIQWCHASWTESMMLGHLKMYKSTKWNKGEYIPVMRSFKLKVPRNYTVFSCTQTTRRRHEMTLKYIQRKTTKSHMHRSNERVCKWVMGLCTR